MASSPDDIDPQGADIGRSMGINLGDFLPGGLAPQPQEIYVAGIILAALGFVILMRRGFGSVLNK